MIFINLFSDVNHFLLLQLILPCIRKKKPMKMKKTNLKLTIKLISSFLLLQFAFLSATAQIKYQAKNDFNLLVSGTSTLHDWDMKSAKGECKAMIAFNDSGLLTSISDLTFVSPAQGLKSGHEGMDLNAYKALKTDKFKNINFILSAAKVNSDGTINGIGKLTIAGVTHDAELIVTYKINHDKSVSISGSKKINLFYYNMQPSVFMGGLFKIGDEINVKFDLTLFKTN